MSEMDLRYTFNAICIQFEPPLTYLLAASPAFLMLFEKPIHENQLQLKPKNRKEEI